MNNVVNSWATRRYSKVVLLVTVIDAGIKTAVLSQNWTGPKPWFFCARIHSRFWHMDWQAMTGQWTTVVSWKLIVFDSSWQASMSPTDAVVMPITAADHPTCLDVWRWSVVETCRLILPPERWVTLPAIRMPYVFSRHCTSATSTISTDHVAAARVSHCHWCRHPLNLNTPQYWRSSHGSATGLVYIDIKWFTISCALSVFMPIFHYVCICGHSGLYLCCIWNWNRSFFSRKPTESKPTTKSPES